MQKVIYRLNYSDRSLRKKRFIFLLSLFIASLIVLVLLILFLLNFIHNNPSQSAVGKQITTRIAGPKLFKNNYFEFYSSDDWSYDAHDSTDNRVMYLLTESGEIAGSFEVYINRTPIPEDLQASRALPVSISGNRLSHIGQVSEPCGQAYKTNTKNIQEISISSTSMLCIPDTSQYILILGQIGGDYNLKMTRSNGQIANYIIIYTSSSYTPSAASFLNLISTFKSL